MQGRIQDFKLGWAHLKKLRRAEGGAKMFGVFRVKNHDFTTKNHIFSNCEGRRENVWGIYIYLYIFFPILEGGARRVRPLWIRPWNAYGSHMFHFGGYMFSESSNLEGVLLLLRYYF